MERLEKFILQNRDDFDTAVPSLKVWAEIDKNLVTRKKGKRVRMWKAMRVAAAVAILLVCGGVAGIYYNDALPQNANSLADLAPEYAELEKFYAQEVNQKTRQLASYQHASLVNEDLKVLDNLFLELMEEYKNAPKGSEDQIIQAMINNYQTKINILETVLGKIESTNNKIIPFEEVDKQQEDEKTISI